MRAPPSSAAGIPARLRRRAAIALAVFFAAEFLLFDLVGARHHTWVFPRWNDQIQYLTESYTGYEYARAHGFFAGLWQTLVNRSAQGTLHDTFALVAFWLAGPSRSAALSLNILALIAWQASLYAAVIRLTGRRSLGWIGVALPLTLSWAFRAQPGSAYDFRLDHLAMCAIGVTLSVAWLSGNLRTWRGGLAFGAAVGVALSCRFLTGAYFLVVFAGFACWFAAARRLRPRLLHLGLAALAATVVAGPFFWINRATVWDYYAIGHFVGPESAIRDADMGLGASVAWVASRIGVQHLGLAFGLVAGFAALALAVGRRRDRQDGAAPELAQGAWVPAALFCGAPAVVLTLHAAKSELTLNAAVPGALGLVLVGLAAIARPIRERWVNRAAIGVVLAAGAVFATRQFRDPHDAAFAAAARQVNAVADDIVRRARAGGLASPTVAVDAVTDCLDGQVLRVIAYERHQAWIPFIMTLPTGIAETTEAVVMERLAGSDFVMLTESAVHEIWPFDRQLSALRPRTRAWCDENLRFVLAFEAPGRQMRLYQRRELPPAR